ncbi:uncharacterized protein LOC119572525 isoform X2 [Penaeus monodon]|uniref:uncharacterized protein LOC119572525 isoform X2 n=1 Tax=Penaeus monodon TaxID=6687 RepID=UPI0018A7CEA6|nr:uncharacterized protein LOC119572525 isoform X2 [Penaeus monodon]
MKRNMRVLCLALTAFLLPAVDSSLFKNMSSADVHNVGRFISDLAQGLRVNVVALCTDEGEVYYRLMSAFIRNLVFFVSCDAATPPTAHEFPRRPPTAHEASRRPPTAPRTGPGVERSFAHTHAEVHLTSRALLGSTVKRARERYMASRGQAWQVILGEDLGPETSAGEGIATWMVANYDKTTQEVALTEVFSFRDSREVVEQDLGRWTSRGRLHLVRPPGAGPRDFHGHVITLASFPVS